MRYPVFFALIILAILIFVYGFAIGNQGAVEIQIDGGNRGVVPFPHQAHQNRINDCNTCHAVFPQEPQALIKQKQAGQLKPKWVMNKQCVKCHRAEKKAGNPSGPTTCSKCHVR
jgi:hypothetical protein